MSSSYKNCKVVGKDVELQVIECLCCGFSLGVDATYLEQIDKDLDIPCPACKVVMTIPCFE